MTSEEMVSRLLYRDALMLVIDKPAGMAVHRGPKGGESLEDYFDALRFGLPRPPALAHRLDRDTSGCLVLGRHRKALADLGKLFKAGRVGKTYWAVVEGGPEADDGRIELPLGRLDASRGWWMKPDETGQPAVTVWKVLGRVGWPATTLPAAHKPQPLRSGDGVASSVPSPLAGEGQGGGYTTHAEARRYPPPHPSPGAKSDVSDLANLRATERGNTRVRLGEGACCPTGKAEQTDEGGDTRQLAWLALEPLTGRTHQLRVHCAAMGWPIVGDTIYGTEAALRRQRNEKPAPRDGGLTLHLHAREIVVPIYKNREPVRVIAPIPDHMRERLSTYGWVGDRGDDQ